MYDTTDLFDNEFVVVTGFVAQTTATDEVRRLDVHISRLQEKLREADIRIEQLEGTIRTHASTHTRTLVQIMQTHAHTNAHVHARTVVHRFDMLEPNTTFAHQGNRLSHNANHNRNAHKVTNPCSRLHEMSLRRCNCNSSCPHV